MSHSKTLWWFSTIWNLKPMVQSWALIILIIWHWCLLRFKIQHSQLQWWKNLDIFDSCLEWRLKINKLWVWLQHCLHNVYWLTYCNSTTERMCCVLNIEPSGQRAFSIQLVLRINKWMWFCWMELLIINCVIAALIFVHSCLVKRALVMQAGQFKLSWSCICGWAWTSKGRISLMVCLMVLKRSKLPKRALVFNLSHLSVLSITVSTRQKSQTPHQLSLLYMWQIIWW